MKIIKAKKGNGGIAIARIAVSSGFIVPENRKITDIWAEMQKYEKALSGARLSYQKIIHSAKSGKDNASADILDAQLMILEDKTFDQAVRNIIEQNYCVEFAIYSAAEKIAEELQKSDSEYLRARCADIRNVAKKMIKMVSGENTEISIAEEAILVAEDISPEEIIRLDKDQIKAIVTVNGSALSHTSILAGTYGMPYIFGIPQLDEIPDGVEAVVDGEEGTLILEPDEETLKEYRNKIEEFNKFANVSSENLPVKLYANIAGPEDIEIVKNSGAEGIGLFRTEFLFMKRKELPSEEEQYKIYRQVAQAMEGKEVIIRTMDIGTDKKTECLTLPEEENPALGKRAIRICLENPDLFRTQLRAILRASCFGNIKIMYPMIAFAWEIDEINEQLRLAEEELKKMNAAYKMPERGIMIETPAAAVISDTLAQKVDFFSIGTNDLTQYTLAADRLSEGMDLYFDSKHEAIFRLIQLSTENAHKYGVTVGICGEMGGNPEIIPRLLEIGVDELSMSPGKIPGAKKAIMEYRNRPEYKIDKKKEETLAGLGEECTEPLQAPCDGTLIFMKDIPDEAFSSGALGNCIGVDPDDGKIYAPCSGEITMVANTKHAIGIKSEMGHDILVHAGIDTVKLNGEGFDCKVEKGQYVKTGDLILTEDIETIKEHGLSPIVVMVY